MYNFMDMLKPAGPDWLNDASLKDAIDRECMISEIYMMNENGFAIYGAEDEDGVSFKVTGDFITPLVIGQSYRIKGNVREFRGERQLAGKNAFSIKPRSKRTIIAYLQTLKGLKNRAEILYETFGGEVLELLLKDPGAVAAQVPGIGAKSVASWQEQLQALEDSQQATLDLMEMGLTKRQIKDLLALFGDEIIQKIKDNPYLLARQVKGYGFLRCDQVARNVGYSLTGIERMQAGLIFAMEESIRQGHCYLPKKEFLTAAYKVLTKDLEPAEREHAPDMDLVKKELDHLILTEGLVEQEDRIYLPRMYKLEGNVAFNLLRILQAEKDNGLVEDRLSLYETRNRISLEDKQREAALTIPSTRGGVQILNGPAGCGKTFTLTVILDLLEEHAALQKREMKIHLFAPTGRAAKVMSRSTGRPGLTIHRGLEYIPDQGFFYCKENKLDADAVVVDESGMMDIELLSHLLDALRPKTKLILLGDVAQLPSVGPGRVLQDLIESGLITVITLDVIKRQGLDSGITRNASRILKGELIESALDTHDSYVINRNDNFTMQEGVIQSIQRVLEKGDYTWDDIQVLVPMKKGDAGTHVLNYVLQQHFNPNPEGEKVLNTIVWKNTRGLTSQEEVKLFFTQGDKVIHTRNNYDLEWYEPRPEGGMKLKKMYGVMNGEIGKIVHISSEIVKGEGKVTSVWVEYEEGFVKYVNSVDELEHAFAITIHKSQGSQWPVVIMAIMMSHYRMLENSIFYTGFTRAEDFQVTIGDIRAMELAISTFRSDKRYTTMSELLTLPKISA